MDLKTLWEKYWKMNFHQVSHRPRQPVNRPHNNLFSLFIEFTTNLRKSGKNYIEKNLIENKDVSWGDIKRTTKDIDNHQLIDKDIDEIELKNRIRGFNFTNHPIELKLHGRSFVLKEDE